MPFKPSSSRKFEETSLSGCLNTRRFRQRSATLALDIGPSSTYENISPGSNSSPVPTKTSNAVSVFHQECGDHRCECQGSLRSEYATVTMYLQAIAASQFTGSLYPLFQPVVCLQIKSQLCCMIFDTKQYPKRPSFRPKFDGSNLRTSFYDFVRRLIGIFFEILNEQAPKFRDLLFELRRSCPRFGRV